MSCTATQSPSRSLTPIKINHLHDKRPDSLFSSPLLKSTISATTIDSPLASPRKTLTQDTELEEDEFCSEFEERGCCSQGVDCDMDHHKERPTWNRSFLLENYPEMLLGRPGRRASSFLC